MKPTYPQYWPQFYTATIQQWKHLLSVNEYKDIIITTLRFMVGEKRIILFGFVIMSNHIHLIWQSLHGHSPSSVQSSFMKNTARQMKALLMKNEERALLDYKVDKYDRKYQIWKREPLSVELRTATVFDQKLSYTIIIR